MKKFSGLFLIVAIIAGFSLAFIAAGESTEPVSVAEGVEIGDQAPDFSLKNVDGKMVSLSDYKKGKGAIIVFTCNTCPYAVMYEDRLNALQAKYAPKGWPIVAINPNSPEARPKDSFADMQVRAKEKKFEFAYLFDDGQKVYPQFGATRTPHVFLVDNTLKVRYIGAIDNNAQDANAVTETYLEDAIAAIDAGKNPEPATTKAIGCSIKTVK
jgi:peroxiredoxin